ncbi:VOC family protein [Gellertiella hungarica]|uniref:VOC domain-containing protein n=1 Tax=Gellertiella hungarica TaxID=1572859 RepID=A0A7W6J701_9HYPH|nr:VOC family protein [Gellertiella hungarica]MBB4065058.1 hypothetical protein [Gellertiella hungarica]
MTRMIFINLPVADLSRSIRFYASIGANQNMQFSDERTACMLLSDSIGVMLLTHDRYRDFISRPIGDAHAESQLLMALTMESRDAVNATVDKGAAGGGRADPTPQQDHGFMFSRSLEDPDGYVWELMWMDMSAVPPQA